MKEQLCIVSLALFVFVAMGREGGSWHNTIFNSNIIIIIILSFFIQLFSKQNNKLLNIVVRCNEQISKSCWICFGNFCLLQLFEPFYFYLRCWLIYFFGGAPGYKIKAKTKSRRESAV